MTFSIGFLPEPSFTEDGDHYRYARIVLGEFEEEFRAELAEWVEEDYERQWREGAQRIVDGLTPSCLVTGLHNPQWYALYLVDGEVAVQEHILLGEEFTSPVYEHVFPYEAPAEEDGDRRSSEWRVSVGSLRQFLEEDG